MMRRLVLFLLFISIFLNITPFTHSVKASVDFTHDIKATYEIISDRNARIEYFFTTTNKVDNNYLQTFSFKLPFEPRNIKVDGSPTEIKISELKKLPEKNTNQLSVEILNPKYGLNNKFEWKFSFDVENFVFDYGRQKGVIIPSFNDEVNISSFNINVLVPESAGQVRTFYGNPKVTNLSGKTLISYSSKDNKASNFLFILGPDQEYQLEINEASRDAYINLPLNNEYQEVLYTEFPQRTFTLSAKEPKNSFLLRKGDRITGVIKANDAYDRKYENIVSKISNEAIIQELKKKIKTEKSDRSGLAHELFYLLNDSFMLGDYLTTVDTSIDIRADKRSLNPAELNKIFRDVLTSYGIESRGVLGYVFPVQAEIRDGAKAQAHIWSEFWDGEKWIVVDPTWYISSKGTDYFDHNSFHHIKFGTYEEVEELKDFIANTGIINVSPMKTEAEVNKNIDISLSVYDDTYLTKDFRLILSNNSNQPVYIDSLTPSLSMKGVKFKDEKVSIDRLLYPNSKIDIALPMEYGLLYRSQKSTVNSSVEYTMLSGQKEKKEFKHTINIKSNISSYFVVLVIIGMFVLLGGLVVVLAIYRDKIGALNGFRAG